MREQGVKDADPLPSAALLREREAKARAKARVEAMIIERGVTAQVIEREDRAAAAKAACGCCTYGHQPRDTRAEAHQLRYPNVWSGEIRGYSCSMCCGKAPPCRVCSRGETERTD